VLSTLCSIFCIICAVYSLCHFLFSDSRIESDKSYFDCDGRFKAMTATDKNGHFQQILMTSPDNRSLPLSYTYNVTTNNSDKVCYILVLTVVTNDSYKLVIATNNNESVTRHVEMIVKHQL